MRSRSNSMEDLAQAKHASQQPLQRQHRQHTPSRQRAAEREEPSARGPGQPRHREPPDDVAATLQRNHKSGSGSGSGSSSSGHSSSGQSGTTGHHHQRGRAASAGKGRDLSRDDLLFLLSMLEGELQARDEVITVLKADKIDLAVLEAKYGFVTPQKVLQALQRDAIQKGDGWQDDIYEKPMAELDRLVEKQRETYRRMLEQLLIVEQSHRQTIYKLEDEKMNHSEFMKKSDEFTNLLEQDRERSVVQAAKP
ncbi:hypothetical protein ACEWY4_016358 [Coilia grayii]|uniref:Cortactin-binding protein-2 N-terminal domain-containing protein n=1 Tax=Coilia grayii TaxID=363190 RepID=A0ABD1JK60_9TELE